MKLLIRHLIRVSVLSLFLVYLCQFLNQFHSQSICSSVFVQADQCMSNNITTTSYKHNNSEHSIYSTTNLYVSNLTAREGDQRFKYNANIGIPSSSLYDNVQRSHSYNLIMCDDIILDVSSNNSFSWHIVEIGSSVAVCWYNFDYSENIIKTYIIVPIAKLIISLNCSIFEHIKQI